MKFSETGTSTVPVDEPQQPLYLLHVFVRHDAVGYGEALLLGRKTDVGVMTSLSEGRAVPRHLQVGLFCCCAASVRGDHLHIGFAQLVIVLFNQAFTRHTLNRTNPFEKVLYVTPAHSEIVKCIIFNRLVPV